MYFFNLQVANGKETSEEAHTLPDLYRPGQFLTASVANSQHNLEGEEDPDGTNFEYVLCRYFHDLV